MQYRISDGKTVQEKSRIGHSTMRWRTLMVCTTVEQAEYLKDKLNRAVETKDGETTSKLLAFATRAKAIQRLIR